MTEIPPGAVTVADLYRELSGMRMDLQAALTSLRVIEERDHNTDRVIDDHESRLRVLEAARAKLWGGAVALGALAGGGAGWIALALAHHG